jgi:phosphoglycerol transferase MdoB-like AlkP superfamily enzyme
VSVTCSDAYANGHRSIDGIPSVISSIPSLMYEPFITSSFGANKLSSLANTLNANGYETSFYHGGHNGTMGFNSYCKNAGFDHYVGLDEYPNKDHYDGAWGIYDHYFLDYAATDIGKKNGPFFSTIFTLSSHHPYSIPAEFQNRFAKGTLPIHESIGYLDYSLDSFLDKASESDWYANTLFVITADHTSLSNGGYYRSYSGILSLPIIFFAPGDTSFAGRISETASQADIFPSVLHLLGHKDEILSFGNDLFSEDEDKFSISFTRDQYQMISSGNVIRFNGENLSASFDIKSDSLQLNNLINRPSLKVDSMQNILKSYIQQFSERAYSNSLKLPPSND